MGTASRNKEWIDVDGERERPPLVVLIAELRRQVEADVPCLEAKLDKERHLVAHVQRDHRAQRGGLGEVV